MPVLDHPACNWSRSFVQADTHFIATSVLKDGDDSTCEMSERASVVLGTAWLLTVDGWLVRLVYKSYRFAHASD